MCIQNYLRLGCNKLALDTDSAPIQPVMALGHLGHRPAAIQHTPLLCSLSRENRNKREVSWIENIFMKHAKLGVVGGLSELGNNQLVD